MKNNTQQMEGYLIDTKITKGLHVTIDPEKIKRNCEYYEIDLSNSPSKISKRNNISILTMGIGNNQLIQFKVQWNLNIKRFNKIDSDIMPNEIKLVIVEAYKLTLEKTINNLIDI